MTNDDFIRGRCANGDEFLCGKMSGHLDECSPTVPEDAPWYLDYIQLMSCGAQYKTEVPDKIKEWMLDPVPEGWSNGRPPDGQICDFLDSDGAVFSRRAVRYRERFGTTLRRENGDWFGWEPGYGTGTLATPMFWRLSNAKNPDAHKASGT